MDLLERFSTTDSDGWEDERLVARHHQGRLDRSCRVVRNPLLYLSNMIIGYSRECAVFRQEHIMLLLLV